MKIQCEKCSTVNNVDDTKNLDHDERIKCKKCGHEQKQSEECEQCGIIFSRYINKTSHKKEINNQSDHQETDLIDTNNNKKISKLIFVGVLIIIPLFFFILSTKKKDTLRETTNTNNSAPYKKEREILPDGYESIEDIIEVFADLSSISEKGEFERTEDYTDRIKQYSGKVYNFKKKVQKYTNYNVDTQTLTIAITNSASFSILESFKETASMYTGSNTFGVTKNVKKITEYYYGLALPYFNKDTLNCQNCTISEVEFQISKIRNGIFPHFTVQIPVSIEFAKKYKKNIDLIYVCSPLPINEKEKYFITPYTKIGLSQKKPTTSEPIDKTLYTLYINASLIRIVIYNNSTGDILATILVTDQGV